MSESCRSYCPNVLDCLSITDGLAAEHDSLERERTALEQISPNPEITAITADYGEQADDLSAHDLGDLLRRYDRSAAKVPEQADLHRYVFSRLAALKRTAAQNSQLLDAVVEPIRLLDSAVAVCKGPTLSFVGGIVLYGDELRGAGPANDLERAYYYSRWAKCRSKAASTALHNMPIV